jgi:ABC-type lipoprotein release transport system permease subunit
MTSRTRQGTPRQGVTPTDPLTFASAIAVMMSVGIAATALPAWRAAHVDPISALKDDYE